MKNIKLLCVRPSVSARQLARSLGIKRHRNEDLPLEGQTIINWGCSSYPRLNNCNVINSLAAVGNSTNKLKAFQILGEDLPVPWTTDKSEAAKWPKIMGRTKLTGHSGEGIVVIDNEKGVDIPDAKVYTKYIPTSAEWRIHVGFGEVFDIQRKVLDPSIPQEERAEKDFDIRSHDRGFIYIRNSSTPCNQACQDAALETIKKLGLDFGAVDVIWNRKHDRAYVLEVNTAPGLVGTTLDNYTQMLMKRVIKEAS